MAVFRNPKSNFLRVKCVDCGNQQVVFDRAASVVQCIICGKTLVKPKGGKSQITAQIVEVLD
jgi:small subunit ribosomal protein S27e